MVTLKNFFLRQLNSPQVPVPIPRSRPPRLSNEIPTGVTSLSSGFHCDIPRAAIIKAFCRNGNSTERIFQLFQLTVC